MREDVTGQVIEMLMSTMKCEERRSAGFEVIIYQFVLFSHQKIARKYLRILLIYCESLSRIFQLGLIYSGGSSAKTSPEVILMQDHAAGVTARGRSSGRTSDMSDDVREIGKGSVSL